MGISFIYPYGTDEENGGGGNLEQRVSTLESNAAKKNEANTFTQKQTINSINTTGNGAVISLKELQGNAGYIEYRDNTRRLGYLGKATSGSNDISVVSENGNLILSGSSYISASNKKISNVGAPSTNNDALRMVDIKYTQLKPEGQINQGNTTFTSTFMATNGYYNFEIRFNVGSYNMVANFKMRKNGTSPATSPIISLSTNDNDHLTSDTQVVLTYDGNQTFTLTFNRNVNYCSVWAYKEF